MNRLIFLSSSNDTETDSLLSETFFSLDVKWNLEMPS